VVVRVRVEVKPGDRAVEAAAVANSGYEAEAPELHLPLALARRLEVSLHALPGESYRVVGGSTHAYVLGEVLLSDRLLDALGIEIARAGLGYWRFSGEGPERLRRSAEAQFWVE
jgi:hypothetical protein